MSADEGDLFGSIDVRMVGELLREPSYISEVTRKMQELNLPRGFDEGELEEVETIQRTWGELTENTALTGVMTILMVLTNEGESEDFEVFRPDYDVEDSGSVGQSQRVGSVHNIRTVDGSGGFWEEYSIIKNVNDNWDVGEVLSDEGYHELASDMQDMVDETMEIDDKANVVSKLSRVGNEMSIYAEEIMQDAMMRQFREYGFRQSSDYNDPGPDFMVADGDRRDYGLVIEVSTRWVNPIGEPYISNKISMALDLEEGEDVSDQPWDVVILAPNFTQSALSNHEDHENPNWHDNPNEGMVHLHRVPSDKPEVYHPFAIRPSDIDKDELDGGGNPVIVPDSNDLRSRMRDTGHVGDDYPVVDDKDEEFEQFLNDVFRDFVVVPEGRYRNMLRESIEPLLWEFMRPYKIEQFLIDMYWDKGLNQSEIGELISRSGSTIGRWMREWGIVRRGTGAPELSDDVKEVWRRMYLGEDPFPEEFSGYRIQAEYNRHPLWDIDDWREWYQNTTEEERKEVSGMQNSFRNNLDYTILVGPNRRLTPSYTFILSTLRDMGVEIRDPDEAPRVPYSAYPSRGALEWMINKNEDTIVDVSEGDFDG